MNDWCADKCDALRVAAHERLGEVLRILRIILERYPALQSTELLVAAGSLIHQVKGRTRLSFINFIQSIILITFQLISSLFDTLSTTSSTTSRRPSSAVQNILTKTKKVTSENSWSPSTSWHWLLVAGRIILFCIIIPSSLSVTRRLKCPSFKCVDHDETTSRVCWGLLCRVRSGFSAGPIGREEVQDGELLTGSSWTRQNVKDVSNRSWWYLTLRRESRGTESNNNTQQQKNDRKEFSQRQTTQTKRKKRERKMELLFYFSLPLLALPSCV